MENEVVSLIRSFNQSPHYRLRLSCSYTDGKGHGILRLDIEWLQNSRPQLFARIFFNEATGRVGRVQCHRYLGKRADHIVDVLLDLHNLSAVPLVL